MENRQAVFSRLGRAAVMRPVRSGRSTTWIVECPCPNDCGKSYSAPTKAALRRKVAAA